MHKNTLSRRDFLKIAGVGLGATALTCSGLKALADRAPTKRAGISYLAIYEE